jgi:hypothetical protein
MTTCDSLQQAQVIGARNRLPGSIDHQLACGRIPRSVHFTLRTA